ncbi:heparan-alpha-glucosaminide N-acetyltransferase [Gynuella sp.]|uniref:heparan-alpha-glucosaminide N-acetyltransferase n=1 Tax=Gynuella sp. TaxID=2969146 RepID=UPI003D0E94C6
MKSRRILELDATRGLAILLMIIFHFSYDLSYFKFADFKVNQGYWDWFRYIIVTLFFSVSGISMVLATRNGIRWKQYLFRVSQVVAGAIAVTLATWFVFPKSWVYFGVLHFIAVSMLAGLLFIRIPVIALITGISIFLLFNLTNWFNLHWLYIELKPILHLPRGTQDLTRFIPWFGMILIGIWLGHQNWRPNLPHSRWLNALAWMGRHSLAIYLIHQIVLFELVNAAYHIKQMLAAS